MLRGDCIMLGSQLAGGVFFDWKILSTELEHYFFL